jgi:hypothetical protein
MLRFLSAYPKQRVHNVMLILDLICAAEAAEAFVQQVT